MGTAIIGDLHFGIHANDERFIEYQIHEWNKFIAYCKVEGINQMVMLGDFFDNRNTISVKILNMVLNQIVNSDMEIILLVGNHDTLFKNTNEVNTPRLIFEKYANINVVDTVKEIYVDDVKCLFVPWMNKDNAENSLDAIKHTGAEYCFGHFEMKDFEMTSGIKCINGLKASMFKRFKGVYSGHFHLVQNIGNIHYLGSFYQTTWADCGDQKFIYTVKAEREVNEYQEFGLTPVPMARTIFKKIHLSKEKPITKGHVDVAADSYVKVYLNYKMTAKDEKILSNLIDCAIKADVIDMRLLLDAPDDQDIGNEDFLEIFSGYMEIQEELDPDLKAGVATLIKKTYHEALEG